jgi:ribosomal subunit interface protein
MRLPPPSRRCFARHMGCTAIEAHHVSFAGLLPRRLVMELPLQITFRGFPQSDALAERIRERVDALNEQFGRITSCHVVVDAPHHHHRKGRLFQVRVELGVPGEEIVVSAGEEAHEHEDVYLAVRDAFDAVKRRLGEHRDRRHPRHQA